MESKIETHHILSLGSSEAVMSEQGIETLAMLQNNGEHFTISHYVAILGEVSSLFLSEVQSDKEYMELQRLLKPLAFLSRDLRKLQNPKKQAQ